MLLRENLKATNSLTKYPSILTYHALGERGRLTGELQVPFGEGPLFASEKIDGTNARIICHAGDYLVGSREELLHARGDCIWNPSMGIVDALVGTDERIASLTRPAQHVTVVYGEVYGGKITSASKQYTSGCAVGFRVFDVVSFEEDEFRAMLTWETARIASWRDSGGQRFLDDLVLNQFAEMSRLELVPHVTTLDSLPCDRAEVLAMMRAVLPETRAGLDVNGRAEGLVVRTPTRSRIAKLRFEDYERNLR